MMEDSKEWKSLLDLIARRDSEGTTSTDDKILAEETKPKLVNKEEEKLTSIRFNQKKNSFICCSNKRVRMFRIEPNFSPVFNIDISSLGIGVLDSCETIDNVQIFASIHRFKSDKGTDSATGAYNANSILIHWETHSTQIPYKEHLISVKCVQNRVVAILVDAIHVYSFINGNKSLMFTLPTRPNPLGLCEIAKARGKNRLVCPDKPKSEIGSLRLTNLGTGDPSTKSHLPQTIKISTHSGELACLSLSQNGKQLATASEKGTLIRVWDTLTGAKLHELRRGTTYATIYSINFSLKSDFLVCCSDKGTGHVFALNDTLMNPRSSFVSLSFLVGGYFESQWSMSTFSVPLGCPSFCAFTPNYSIVVVSMDGTMDLYEPLPSLQKLALARSLRFI